MLADDAAKVATTYFDAWKVNEFDTMRSLEVFVDGPDVLTWFDLHTTVAPPVPSPIGCTSRTASRWRSMPANSLPEPADLLRDGADP